MKRVLSLLIVIIFIISIAACSSGSASGTAVTDSQENLNEAESEIVTEPERKHNVPSGLDFDGKEFNMAYANWQGYVYYFFADELTGDAMNDAIYDRKSKVEDYLNVKIIQTNCDTLDKTASEIKKVALAGDSTYSQGFLHCITGISDLAAGGYLYNWDDLKYTDFSADWWNQEQMEVLRLGKKTYYGVSDFMIPCPYVVYFNKNMISNYGLDNPYQLVYDNKWTLDKFSEMCQAVVKDINGDGVMNVNDQYGVVGSDSSLYISFMTGADQFITTKNDGGKIELALNTEKTVKIIEKFVSLKNADSIYQIKSGTSEADKLDMDSGRVLFVLGSVANALDMRDYEVDFGFLPYPKYDENQKDYRSLDWGGLCCIPASIDDPEFVGAVSELLAFESKNAVIPTYYDIVLSGKLARDEDTLNMLDILFDTICYEVGGNYFGFSGGFSPLFYSIPNLAIDKGSTDFGSWYASNEKTANATIDKFYTALEASE